MPGARRQGISTSIRDTTDEGATNYTWIETDIGQRRPLNAQEKRGEQLLPSSARVMQPYPMFSDGPSARDQPLLWSGWSLEPSRNSHWKTHGDGLTQVARADRFVAQGKTLRFVNYLDDYSVTPTFNVWTDTQTSGFGADRLYVVQTSPKVIERCLLMTTDPGDLVLDPTCGSGTTAFVAEQWGRRWITIDTSRVALALARARIMGAKYPWYLLADSPEGQKRSRGDAHGTLDAADPRRHPPRLRLPARAPHHAQGDRQQHRDRRDLGAHAAGRRGRARRLNAALAGHAVPFKVTTGGRAGKQIDFTATGEVELPSGEIAPANGFMEWEIPREAPDGWPDEAEGGARKNSGRRASPARARSTPRSRPRPSTNISTTSPTRTASACASPGRSRSRACRRTACRRSTSTAS